MPRLAIIALLRSKGKATNRDMIRTIDGDAELFLEVREDLILNDLARDKDGVGLIWTGPAEEAASSLPSTLSAPAPATPGPDGPTRMPRAKLFL